MERLEAAVVVVVVRSDLFGGDAVGGLVVVVVLCWRQRQRQKGKLAKLLRKCNEKMINVKSRSWPLSKWRISRPRSSPSSSRHR